MTRLEAALQYAGLGWWIFPLQGKRPITSHGHLNASKDPRKIERWWSRHPNANIGVWLRKSGLIAVDVDVDGKPGRSTLADLERRLGALPRDCHQRSASGGEHFIMRDPTGDPDSKTSMPGTLGPGIDLKSNGYVLLSPSATSKGRYEWMSQRDPPAMPDAWVRALPTASDSAAEVVHVEPAERVVTERIRRLIPWVGLRNTIVLGTDGDRSGVLFHTVRKMIEWCGLDDETIASIIGDPQYGISAHVLGEANPRRAIDRVIANVHARIDQEPDKDLDQADTERDAGWPPLACDVLSIDRPPLRTYTTGFRELDDRLGGGVTSRSVTALVARTGAGKSGLAIAIGLHVARVHQLPFLYVSTELDEDECAMRAAAQILSVSHSDLLRGRVPRARGRDALVDVPISVVGCEHLQRNEKDLARIDDAISRVADRHSVPPFVCVDYLQNLTSAEPANVRAGVTSVANALRSMSQRHDCALLAVSSTGRGFYKTPREGADDPLTYLSAAKESGDVEFASVNVLFLDVRNDHDAEFFYPARLIVSKARRGTIGMVGARFHGPTGRWDEQPDTLESLSAEGREMRRSDEHDARVLAAVEVNPAMPWRRLRSVCGVGPAVADATRDRLVEIGRLVERTGPRGTLTYAIPGGAP